MFAVFIKLVLLTAQGKRHEQAHNLARGIELTSLGVAGLFGTTDDNLEYRSHHGVGHHIGVQVGSLYKQLDDRKQLVTTLQAGVDRCQVNNLAVCVAVHKVGENVLHVVGKAVEIGLKGLTDLFGSTEESFQRKPRCVEER